MTDADAWNGGAPGALGVGLPAASAVKQAEARLVAQRVGALVHEEGIAPRDVVVLLRASAEMGLYERALELAGLPTLAGGGRGWWGRQQIRDLCHLLAALANPRDEEALLGLLASPMVGLSSDALALLALNARERRTTIWDAVHEEALAPAPEDARRLGVFREWFAHERERAPRLGLDEVLAARAAAHPLRPAHARAAARRAAAGQRPQAAAHGGGLRGAPRARRARASSTSPPPSSRPTRASPTRPSTSAASTRCG